MSATLLLCDRRTELRQQYRALHYMQSHGKNDEYQHFKSMYCTGTSSMKWYSSVTET